MPPIVVPGSLVFIYILWSQGLGSDSEFACSPDSNAVADYDVPGSGRLRLQVRRVT